MNLVLYLKDQSQKLLIIEIINEKKYKENKIVYDFY